MATDRQIFDLIVGSVGYKTTVGPIDKSKVQKAIEGKPSVKPSAKLAQAAWHLARRINPPLPPPPPPPPAVKVAPITVTQQGGSDQRVCLFTGTVEGGPLRPGVRKIESGPNKGKFTDDSGAIYESNGLENSSVRTKLPEGAFGLVKAREMDSRNACQCHTAGSPDDNTGSWTV